MSTTTLFVLWSRIKKEGRMVWSLLRNPQAPGVSKAVALLALLYLVSPFDLVGDFFPILGWLDDALVVSGLLWLSYRFLPHELYETMRQRANAGQTAQAGNPLGNPRR